MTAPPDFHATAREQVDGYVGACFPMLCESCKESLRQDIAAALAAAYQQGREAGFRLGFDDGVNTVDKFGEVRETADEAWEYRCRLAAAPSNPAPQQKGYSVLDWDDMVRRDGGKTPFGDCRRCRFENGRWYPCRKHQPRPAVESER